MSQMHGDVAAAPDAKLAVHEAYDGGTGPEVGVGRAAVLTRTWGWRRVAAGIVVVAAVAAGSWWAGWHWHPGPKPVVEQMSSWTSGNVDEAMFQYTVRPSDGAEYVTFQYHNTSGNTLHLVNRPSDDLFPLIVRLAPSNMNLDVWSDPRSNASTAVDVAPGGAFQVSLVVDYRRTDFPIAAGASQGWDEFTVDTEGSTLTLPLERPIEVQGPETE